MSKILNLGKLKFKEKGNWDTYYVGLDVHGEHFWIKKSAYYSFACKDNIMGKIKVLDDGIGFCTSEEYENVVHNAIIDYVFENKWVALDYLLPDGLKSKKWDLTKFDEKGNIKGIEAIIEETKEKSPESAAKKQSRNNIER